MSEVGLSGPAPPPAAARRLALWAGWIAAAVAAFAVGSALGQADDPLRLLVLAVLGGLAVAAASARLRWCLVGALFLLMAYIPNVLAGPSSAHAVTAVILAGALARWAAGRERFSVPPELIVFAALALAYVAASLFASDRGAAVAETLDLVSYGVVAGMLIVLLDSPAWLRRAVWAVVAGVGSLAFLAIVQQVTKTYGSSYGGFAGVLPAGEALRSAGPLNPNPFGQVLVTAAVLAFYLALVHSRPSARALAAALAVVCATGVVYTQSRAALVTLVLAAVAVALFRGVRLHVVAATVCAAIVLGALLLPNTLQQRVGALSEAVSSGGASLEDGSLRGRKSENLAGLQMWADHPLIGVGPDNFEVHYRDYSAAIGIDQRTQRRAAHNLYLESLAETGLLGTLAFFGVLWLALTGAWRARSRLEGNEALLGEGLLVALGAFLICAVTLHSAYARYQWIFVGLGLAARRLARSSAR